MRIGMSATCSDQHLIYLRVFLNSITINNPGLDIPFHVFCHMPNNHYFRALSVESRDELKRWYPNIVFVNIDPELYAENNKGIQYYCLEAFGLEGFDKIIHWDADMLNVKPLEPILNFETDLAMMKERARHDKTYNNGCIIIGKKYISHELKNKLLSLTADKSFPAYGTDQAMLSQYFDGKITNVPQCFNCLDTEQRFTEPERVINWHYIIKPDCPDLVDRCGQAVKDLWDDYNRRTI